MVDFEQKEHYTAQDLVRIVSLLRDPVNGCPWDKEQTHQSIRSNFIEETYEALEAIDLGDAHLLEEELGDVLLQVALHCQMEAEKGVFDFDSVCDGICKKLIYRHPHVFGETKVGGAHDVELNWEQIKLKEKDGNHSVLGGVPAALPALIKAFRVQEKAANVGFDWEKREDVWAKVEEERSEVRQAIDAGDPEQTEAEFGDLLFAVVNAARLYGVNPENALEKTNRKFIARFNYIEKRAAEKGLKLKDMTLGQMDELWKEAKRELSAK